MQSFPRNEMHSSPAQRVKSIGAFRSRWQRGEIERQVLFLRQLLRQLDDKHGAAVLLAFDPDVPLMLFNGTAMEHIMPSAVLPAMVRLAHFIELGFSMIVVGLFMVWLFIKDADETAQEPVLQAQSAPVSS